MDPKPFMADKNEKPLDNILSDGGSCAIFRAIACIGDSLASGEFETVDGCGNVSFHDIYPYSWGQFIARTTGALVHNFSRGGMTAKEYVTSFAEQNGFWDSNKRAQCYVIALGVNDGAGVRVPSGDSGDVDPLNKDNNNLDTFIGQYGYIISRYREISPNSVFFLLTIPRDDEEDINSPKNGFRKLHSDIIYKLADIFPRTYVVDFFRYGPLCDAEFRKNFYLRGHLCPTGYLLFGKIIASYMDYIIRTHPEDFKYIGLINTSYENTIPKENL